jgi:hypothetical protein
MRVIKTVAISIFSGILVFACSYAIQFFIFWLVLGISHGKTSLDVENALRLWLTGLVVTSVFLYIFLHFYSDSSIQDKRKNGAVFWIINILVFAVFYLMMASQLNNNVQMIHV